MSYNCYTLFKEYYGRTKELEIELEKARQCLSFKDSAKLLEENKRLNEKIDEIMSYIPKIGESSYASLIKENEKLRECIGFYANKTTDIIAVRARKTLSEIGNER